MKKRIFIILIMIMPLVAFSQAPELKNMMPNSWEKLTRLSEQEEIEFFNQQQVINDIENIKSESWAAPKFIIKEKRVYKETANNVDFYRVLTCNQNMADFLTAEYKDTTVLKDEYNNYIHNGINQIIYASRRTKELIKIRTLEYKVYGVAEGNMETPGGEYFIFHDLFIKELNKDEIGFFLTEASTGYTIKRVGNSISCSYLKTKDQQSGANSCEFLRVNNNEDFVSAFSNNDRRIRINASYYLFDSKCPLKYSIQNAFDGNPATSYVENTEDDLFDLEIKGLKDFNVTGLLLINGYARNNLYLENNRFADYQYNSKGEGKLINNLKLKDNYLGYQEFLNCFSNNPHTITSGTTVIYLGTKYNDTCLAEFNLICKNNSLLFGEVNE